MKSIIVLTLVFATTFSASAMKNRPHHNVQHNCIYVIAMDNEIFYFKSDKDVAGATIHVYDFKTDKEVMTDTITTRKMILDFYSQKPADYIIMITKGDFERRYVFEKK
jgi:hypothetical protein